AIGVGLALGLVLAKFAVDHTTFERKPDGTYFTTKPWIGLVVTALFLGRLGARVITMSQGMDAAAPPQMGRSPMTLGLFFLLAAYYVPFYVVVLRRDSALRATT